MKTEPLLIAIGGGGFCEEQDPGLEEVIFASMTNKRISRKTPRIGYIGTANLDRVELITRFHRRFGALGADTSDLSSNASLNDAENWLSNLDAIYIGGGNTVRLLEHWRKLGLDNLLREAAHDGLILSGVSAGAVCWFDYALVDFGRGNFQPLECLGIFSGSCCPHYSSEPERQSVFANLILTGALPGGIAIDDGVAVKLQGDSVVGQYAARADAGALRVRTIANKILNQVIFPIN